MEGFEDFHFDLTEVGESLLLRNSLFDDNGELLFDNGNGDPLLSGSDYDYGFMTSVASGGNSEFDGSETSDDHVEIDVGSPQNSENDRETLQPSPCLYQSNRSGSGYEQKTKPPSRVIRVASMAPRNNALNQLSSPLNQESNDKCLSKSAVAARENRQKKKQYIQSLEQTVGKLRKENVTLIKDKTSLTDSVSELKGEVCYLRNILANQGVLGKLLKAIPGVSGINLRSSLVSLVNMDEEPLKKRAKIGPPTESLDHSYYSTSNTPSHSFSGVKSQAVFKGPGVCLHVSGNNVSLEFCAKCNNKSLDM